MAYAATIGFFDGVHKGHQYLLSELLRVAAENGLQSAVLTLDKHPETVLSGHTKPLLTTVEERAELLKQSGVDEIFLFQFEVIQQMTAAEFMRVIHDRYGVEILLMGYDHRFGNDCMTEFSDYDAIGREVGLKLVQVEEAPEGAVSSSKIRKALLRGDIECANEMLGYKYMLSGKVVHGNGIGHTIGFPTANVKPEECKLVPAAGVYEATVMGYGLRVMGDGLRVTGDGLAESGESYRALVNIGTNPTVGNENVTIEAYLIDYQGESLYGKALTLRFLHRIREEQRFDSLEALKAQIKMDLATIKTEKNH